ncbi:type IV secretory system conjugative DNA transfer family protein [Mesomycoplasma ovipneumoniae]|uniref:type IV secretory system conjugative DNA transfer family protein n=1 Tax=Mesomycoplasma ovipneumoniae TaxID=29562 RepID=UPI00296543A2|nr:type IV secretory system conjugative DNA transfer family protein [Mesomycoplasma ovipneumoniae]MDW2861073.1 type IV secretory system conjugative DNA transfer family protein [Mesomycoplasma ovipneumoniae]
MKNIIKKLPKWGQHIFVGVVSYLISFIFTFFVWPFIFKYNINNIFETFSLQAQDTVRMIYIILASFLALIVIYPITWFFINLSNNKYSSELNSDFIFYDEVEKKGSKKEFDRKFLATVENQNSGWVIKTDLINTKIKQINFFVSSKSHAFILGDTRSGKTQKFIIPTIKYNIHLKDENKRPNLMIIDPKGELFTSLSEEIEKQRYETVLLDFQNLGKSRGINFLAPIWDKFHSPYKSDSEKLQNYDVASNWLQKTIESIHEWDNNSKDSFWSKQAKEVLYIIGWYLLLYSKVDKSFTREKYVFANFTYFLSLEAFKQGPWIQVCKNTDDKELSAFYNEKIAQFISTNPDTLTSILVNAYGAVSKFNAIGLKMFSSQDATDFDKLIKQSDPEFAEQFDGKTRPFALFITFQLDSNLGQLMIPSIINNCYSSLITIANSKSNRRNFRDFLFLGDEFGNLPSIYQMATKMSTAASYGIYFALVLQNIQQLEKYGKESDTILSNSALKIYFRSNDIKSLETFAKFAGKKDVIKKSFSQPADSKKESTSSSLSEENIITVNKLAQMPPEESWIFITGLKPIHVKSNFAYEIWKDPQKSLESFYEGKETLFDFSGIEFDFKTKANNLKIAHLSNKAKKTRPITNEEANAKNDKNNSDNPAKIEPDNKNKILKKRIEFQNEDKKIDVLSKSDSSESKNNDEIQKLINKAKREIEQAQNRKLNVETIEEAKQLDDIIQKNLEQLRDLSQKLK